MVNYTLHQDLTIDEIILKYFFTDVLEKHDLLSTYMHFNYHSTKVFNLISTTCSLNLSRDNLIAIA